MSANNQKMKTESMKCSWRSQILNHLVCGAVLSKQQQKEEKNKKNWSKNALHVLPQVTRWVAAGQDPSMACPCRQPCPFSHRSSHLGIPAQDAVVRVRAARDLACHPTKSIVLATRQLAVGRFHRCSCRPRRLVEGVFSFLRTAWCSLLIPVNWPWLTLTTCLPLKSQVILTSHCMAKC